MPSRRVARIIVDDSSPAASDRGGLQDSALRYEMASNGEEGFIG